MNFFVTGTDTNVGKTFVSTLLIRSLRAAGIDAVGMKPICCGDRADAEALCAAGDFSVSLEDVNPVWLRTPASPFAAAIAENRAVDLAPIRSAFARLREAHPSLVIEGAGGWLVPISRDFFMSDLAAEFGLPVVVVVKNQLGAINHALLTVREIRTRGLECAGIVLNNVSSAPDVATTMNRSVLETVLEVPILFEISPNQTDLAPVAAWVRSRH